MARAARNRFTFLLLGALLLAVAWRLEVHEATPSSPRSAPAQARAEGNEGGSRRDLAWDQQQGGHTLTRHVGRSTSELAERLASERGIAAASSFVDRETAERVVGLTLAGGQDRIARWLRRDNENLTLDYRGKAGQRIGWVLLRGEATPRAASDARVVLRQRGGRYFVLTSYPVEP